MEGKVIKREARQLIARHENQIHDKEMKCNIMKWRGREGNQVQTM